MKDAQVELRRGARECLMVDHAVGPAHDKVIGMDLGNLGGEFREWRRSDGDCATGGRRKFGDGSQEQSVPVCWPMPLRLSQVSRPLILAFAVFRGGTETSQGSVR